MQVFCGEINERPIYIKAFPYYSNFMGWFYFPFCMSTIIINDPWLLCRNSGISAGKITISFRLEYWVSEFFFL